MIPTAMQIQLKKVNDIPKGSRICHYDELSPPAKEHFPQVVGEESIDLSEQVIDSLEKCEVVKYTSYFEVSVANGLKSD